MNLNDGLKVVESCYNGLASSENPPMETISGSLETFFFIFLVGNDWNLF